MSLDTSVKNPNIKFTDIGGVAVLLTNKSSANSVKGKIVHCSPANDESVALSDADDNDTIGAFLDDGVPDGNKAWIVVSGIVDLLMKDNTAATRSNWVKVSDEAGFADATLAVPPGGGIPEIDEHFTELGHCLQSVAATGGGTHVLARCLIHFN